MTDLEAFKFGFLLRCADEALSPEETNERVTLAGLVAKQAAEGEGGSMFNFGNLRKALGAGLGVSGLYNRDPASVISGMIIGDTQVPTPVGNTGLAALGLAGATALGAGGGYLGAKATEQPLDPDEAKKQELIAAMRQHADRARRTAARIGYRMQQERQTVPRSPRLHSA